MAVPRTLNYRQRLFVCHYLGKANGNASEAAKLAGYKNPESTGQQLLQHPIVYSAVQAKLDEASMKSDEVLARLSDMASTDVNDFLSEYEHQVGVDPDTGEPILETRLKFDYAKAKQRGKTHLLKKVKVLPDGSVEFEPHNSADALDKLAKVHGLYKERIDVHAIIGDTEEDRRRFVTIFGAFAQLERAGVGGEVGCEAEPGSPGNLSHEWGVGAGETLALPEPEVEGGGSGGD